MFCGWGGVWHTTFASAIPTACRATVLPLHIGPILYQRLQPIEWSTVCTKHLAHKAPSLIRLNPCSALLICKQELSRHVPTNVCRRLLFHLLVALPVAFCHISSHQFVSCFLHSVQVSHISYPMKISRTSCYACPVNWLDLRGHAVMTNIRSILRCIQHSIILNLVR